MGDEIVFFATPRSGSSNLVRILSGFPNVASFGEVFHAQGFRAGAIGQEDFAVFVEGMGKNEGFLATGARKRPLVAMNLMERFADAQGRPIFTMKIFPGHLKPKKFEKLINTRKPRSVLLHRRPIDTYISLQKARSHRKWARIDTTDMTVSLKPDGFIAWRRSVENYYIRAKELLTAAGATFAVLAYEDLYADGGYAHERVDQIVRELGMNPGPWTAQREMIKQDKATSREEQVVNWGPFLRALERREAVHLLEEPFLPRPNSEPIP